MAEVSVASTYAVWDAAKKLSAEHGGPRGVEKAAAADPTVLDVLALPKARGIPPNFKDLVDIVIPTIRDLVFLEAWRPLWQGCHLIIIKDGDPSKKVAVPAGYTYEMYTRDDVERILGDRAKCISQRSAACRCFGFLVSKKKYIYTIDDDCFVCKDPQGNDVDALKGHFQNLMTPSTPYYFNTMYDPFEEDADFVACYPFGLRSGVQTAVSHGMWLNIPDYDGPTQLAIDRSEKPAEVSTRYVDAVVTIPKGVLYSNCGMNLAFDRDLVGPCMYFGLMGKGTPWGRYEDMWAGWTTKVICDHLGLGVKTGKPYIWHSKASNAFANWDVEVNGIDWQETIVPFFQNMKFSPEAANVVDCYREIAVKVREELVALDEYFLILADMMEVWLDAWEAMNPNHKGYEKKTTGSS